ncbi:YaiO family outer membrane beta-barrel protein [Fodinibius sp. AD559]|uniref:YaiO family outer membrane beta-barrel protein n=1 Tax=Fodinibius sp. AD559 TaxID=3424179 RepID=UPI004046D8D6
MKKIITICIGFLLIGSATVLAQEMEDFTVGELYKKARTVAFDDGDYEKARKYAYEALDRSPDYHGIRIFVARLYSWEGNYEKAVEELSDVLDKDPQNRRALMALVDTQKWSGEMDEALKTANRGLEYYPSDTEFMLTKGSVLYGMENYEEAEQTYKRILADDSGNRKAREELKDVQLHQMKYRATVSYRYDRFRTRFDPWQFTQFGLTRQTPIGSIIGRVEYARRFGSDGVQFNIDAYPSIAPGLYAYVNAGYSQSSIYPDYRFGFSLYKSLPSGFELEAGMRYLDFETSQTDIYTVSLTKYLGSYLFTAQTYLVPSSGHTSKSLNLVTRRYFGTAESYLSLNAGYGSSPIEIEISPNTVSIKALDSWSVSIDGQYPLSEVWFIGGNVGFDSSEYPNNFTRERFSAKVNISYRF